MSTVAPPVPVREIENVFIPLSDGTRLAARIWLPQDAERAPVPAILEYIPYRKRDFMRTRDEPMHRYFAGHGYAALRVDLRGSGDSDGILHDEYLPQEQMDAVELIAWIAAQPWCDGNVGMTGISWGGFNALQVAARQPPALKAIITLCASDDRYADDAHYMGGCLLNENQIWGTVLFALNALPPDPVLVGERWRDLWLARLEADRPFPATWLRHQHRDAYWRQGSVCEDFSRIRCPVYAVGGWADGYSNAVPRLMAGLDVPRKGLIGPWAHTFPHLGVPGPAIGYLQEALRWWDRWLKGHDTGIDREPAMRIWMRDGSAAATAPDPVSTDQGAADQPGFWIAEDSWPPAGHHAQTWLLSALTATSGALTREARPPAAPQFMTLAPSQTTGLASGTWCEFGIDGEAPRDQRADDGRSLVFDSAPLSSALPFVGAPVVHLRVAVDQPVAFLAVRLNEVAPTGESARVTYGVLNLTHRNGNAAPQPVTPGAAMDIAVSMNDVAHRFAAGSSIRLAVSTAFWPVVWPSPRPVTLTLYPAASRLTLPVRPPRAEDAHLAPFAPPESARRTSRQDALVPHHYTRTVERDLTSDCVTYRMVSEGGDLERGSIARIDAIDLELGHWVERAFTIHETDPAQARTAISERLLLRRDGWSVTVAAQTVTTASETEFRVQATLEATENDAPVFAREFDERIARELI